MFFHSCNGTNIFIQWKMKCSIALINIHYLYNIAGLKNTRCFQFVGKYTHKLYKTCDPNASVHVKRHVIWVNDPMSILVYLIIYAFIFYLCFYLFVSTETNQWREPSKAGGLSQETRSHEKMWVKLGLITQTFYVELEVHHFENLQRCDQRARYMGRVPCLPKSEAKQSRCNEMDLHQLPGSLCSSPQLYSITAGDLVKIHLLAVQTTRWLKYWYVPYQIGQKYTPLPLSSTWSLPSNICPRDASTCSCYHIVYIMQPF